MRNLVLYDVNTYATGVEDGKLIAVNALAETSFIATKTEVTEYSVNEKQSTNYVSLCADGYLDANNPEDRIINVEYLLDEDQVCICTSKGDVMVWQPDSNLLENVGSVEAGFSSIAWSPDQELLVLATGNGTFILMTKDFDALCEHPLHTDDFGEAKQMNVGWGKKETQFHGSEGKEAAKIKKPEKSSSIVATDDRRTEISWRGDGEMFAVSSVNSKDGCRYIRIYDREGTLQATNEFIESMEHCLSWRPSGNLITCSQQKPNKHDVIFLEKNGLQHGEFTLPFTKGERIITSLKWNQTSEILTIISKDAKESQYFVQLWTTGNYHWYLKQELRLQHSSQPCVSWDPENHYKLHILLKDGNYKQLTYTYSLMQSKGENNMAMVAAIDGANLLLTPFKLMVLPPPLATHTVKLPTPVFQVDFGSGKSRHNLVVQSSERNFYHVIYNDQSNAYETQQLWSEGIGELPLHHLVYWSENKVAALYKEDSVDHIAFLTISDGKILLDLSMKLELAEGERPLMLVKSEDDLPILLLYTTTGFVYELNDPTSLQPKLSSAPLTLPFLSTHVSMTRIMGKDYVFGLTSHYRLQMNEHEIARDCTSFFIHDEFLLLTTHSHSLRCIYLKSLVEKPTQGDSLSFDESTRRVERGSKIVTAVRNGTAVVLQMPRGNLECIHPRALVVTCLQKLLDQIRYREAVEIMRRNRINLNLLYDHNPNLFLDNAAKFVEDVNAVDRINLFLADLSSEDVSSTYYEPFYRERDKKEEGISNPAPASKVDTVCKAVRDAIIQSPNKERFLLALLTTYARQSTPDLETVLLKIKELKDNPSSSQGVVTHEKALSYILYLVDVNNLFDIALGLYDFDVVLMVAEKSQKDPKEYLPFLNNFKNMESNYQKFSIDKYLKRYSNALLHLVKCDDRFTECLEFIKEHFLYKEGLSMYEKDSSNYKEISFEYGCHLQKKKIYEEAAIVFSRCGHHAEALESLKHTSNWHMAFMQAQELSYSDEQLIELSRTFSERLKGYRMFSDAALLLEQYAKDIEESVVCLLEGSLWFNALNLIHKYKREDLIETNVKPSVKETYEQISEKISDLKETFAKHQNRLRIVVENKKREEYEIMEGLRDDPENDLYSDTSSITGQSAISTSSKGSKGTRTSGHSRKSRNKTERKKYSLREGSKHEDFALREALAEIVLTTDKMKEEITSLLKVLMFFFYEDQATNLQASFDKLLILIEKNRNEIWVPETTDKDQESQFEFGPGATVQDIVNRKIQPPPGSSQKKSDLPTPTQPTIRSSVKWKLNVLAS